MARRHGVLAAILLLAAALRFVGLGWGLRHAPDWDERVFVESAAWMVAERDLDHRFYEYPALFVYALAPVVALFPGPDMPPTAYAAARGLVAAFSLASVALTWHLGRRLAGPWGAATAALLVAVQPIEIRTAHEVRPDVALHAFFLVGLVLILRIGESRRRDLLAGIGLAAAGAVKFTGALLVPSYVVHRLLTPGARGRGLAVAGVVALAGFFILSPYSLLNAGRFADGIRTQIEYHYDGRSKAEGGYGDKLLKQASLLFESFGPAASFLVVLGVFLAARRPREWGAVLTLPLVVLAVLATAEVQWPRFLVPILGPLALSAGLAFEALLTNRRLLAAPLLVVAALPPLVASVGHVRTLSSPTTLDLALDWMDAHVAAGSRVLTTQPDLGLDRRRYDVLTAPRLDAGTRLWAEHMDAVVVGPKDAPEIVATFDEIFAAPQAPGRIGSEIRILKPRDGARARYAVVALKAEYIRVSENAGLVPALLDGNPETVWQTHGRQVPGESWLEVDLPKDTVVGRVRLDLGVRRRRFARNVHVFVRRDGGWARVPAFPGFPESEQPAAQEYILAPVATRGVRLVQVGTRGKHWAVAELIVESPIRKASGSE